MDLADFAMFGAGAAIIIGFKFRLRSAIKNFDKGRTLGHYRQRNPDSFRNGRVLCNVCESSNIYLRKVGHGMGSICNSHVCRQCGTELYRSKTKA